MNSSPVEFHDYILIYRPGYRFFVPLAKTKMADTTSVFVDVDSFMEGYKPDKGTSMW